MPININGTTGISGADGSAATPAIQGADTNTGIFFPAADTVAVSTGGSERMRIDTSGNINIATAGARITGDFSNATAANRVIFQSSTVNGGSSVGVIPNGSGTFGQFSAYSSSDPNNSSVANVSAISSTEVRFVSGVLGTGTYLPMTFYTGGSERMRVDTSGNVGIGQSYGLANSKLVVAGQSPGADGAYATGVGSIVLNEGGRTALSNNGGIEFKTSVFGSGYGAKIIALDAGELVIGQRSNSATWSERARIDSSGQMWTTNGAGSVSRAYDCRAWVNFNGTGTVAIRASGNVSSITDNGTGNYTVNFTTAMPDANYAANITSNSASSSTSNNLSALNASSLQFFVTQNSSVADLSVICASVFR